MGLSDIMYIATKRIIAAKPEQVKHFVLASRKYAGVDASQSWQESVVRLAFVKQPEISLNQAGSFDSKLALNPA